MWGRGGGKRGGDQWTGARDKWWHGRRCVGACDCPGLSVIVPLPYDARSRCTHTHTTRARDAGLLCVALRALAWMLPTFASASPRRLTAMAPRERLIVSCDQVDTQPEGCEACSAERARASRHATSQPTNSSRTVAHAAAHAATNSRAARQPKVGSTRHDHSGGSCRGGEGDLSEQR